MRPIWELRRPPLLTGGAFVVLGLASFGFWFTEPYLPIRMLFGGLAIVSVILALTNRDRMLLALLALYAATTTLLSLFLTQAIPTVLIFAAVAMLAALLTAFLLSADTPAMRLMAAGNGLLITQFFWLIAPWPFDPASQAAIVTILFYILATLLRKEYTPKVIVTGAVWLFVVLFVILSVAEWQI